MIRITLLTLFVAFLCAYAWKDWYKSLMGLIVLMAFMQHPDMPTNMLGIQGLNPWNILMLNILAAWSVQRRKERLAWTLPRSMNILLLLYFAIILLAFFRMIGDTGMLQASREALGMKPASTLSLWSDYFINSFKWVIPGLLVCHGCNSKERFYWTVTAIILFYLLLAIQVIKWMPLSHLGGIELKDRGAKILDKEIGYHRVDIAMMLAGAFWATFVLSTTVRKRFIKWSLYFACLLIVLGLALTGGRTGYGTWLATGLVLALFKWRRFLVILPIAVVVVVLTMPFVIDRLSQGFRSDNTQKNVLLEKDGVYTPSGDGIDLYTVTAGRVIAWPFVIEKISKAPWTGYGRLAMMRTGVAYLLVTNYGETFPHPHNAYLEIIFDNGLPLGIVVIAFFLLLWRHSINLVRQTGLPQLQTAGGILASILTAQLIASLGAQSFYPNDDSVVLWCAIGLMLKAKYPDRAFLGTLRKQAAAIMRPRRVRAPIAAAHRSHVIVRRPTGSPH